MLLFRLGQLLPPKGRRAYKPIYYLLLDVVMGISLPLNTQIGPALTIRHGQGIVISWKSRIGTNCEIHQNVTLGEHRGHAPTVGNNVNIGANAVLIGGIHIGDQARIGAGAVVIDDVPEGTTAVGNPARIIDRRSSL